MQQLFREEVHAHRTQRLHGEVVLGQPRSTRLMVIALVIIIAGAITWISVGTYARIETAPGILVTSQPSAKVVPSVPGIITSLSVTEGSVVQKGQRLAIVQLDRSGEASAGFASEGIAALESRMALTKAQIGLAGARMASERARLRDTISSAETRQGQLTEQIALQQQIVASSKQLFDQIAEVVERGFVSKFEFERRRQTYLNSQQQLSALEQQRGVARSEAAQARAQIAGIEADGASRVSDIQSSIQAMSQQGAELQGQRAYVLTAPIAGRVTALQIAEGRTASPTSPAMIIVPSGSQLKAEVYAPSRAIGFVQPGQETRLLYDAFPYQRFGSFGGRIASVSRIVIDPRDTDVPIKLEEPVYRISVALDRQAIQAFGNQLPLQPGMTLRANIVLERQSFLDWLLMPLRAVINRS